MDNYYVKNSKRIQREIDLAIPHFRKAVAREYGNEIAERVTRQTLTRFAELLPETPYIGGDENLLTENLYSAVALIALYQALKELGKSDLEIARLIYAGTTSMYASFPFNLMLWLQGRKLFSRKGQSKLQIRAAASQERIYPGDWVSAYIHGDGRSFEFGVDYTECGILKYLRAQGAEGLAPYLCWLDVPMCRMQRVALMRTQTLASGGDRCDFRFSRWGAHPEMLPDFLKD